MRHKSSLHKPGVFLALLRRIPASQRCPGLDTLPTVFSNVGVYIQFGEVSGRPHEHAATSLQPALLVCEAEGLHKLVNVNAAVLVAVNGDSQVGDGLVRDLHLQVDA